VIVGLANHSVLIAKDGTERAIDDSAAPIHTAERLTPEPLERFSCFAMSLSAGPTSVRFGRAASGFE
jgi:hypothetical protein